MKQNKKIKIGFLIDEINIGGTENQLLKILEYIDKNRFQVHLICLRNSNFFSTINSRGFRKTIININRLFSFKSIAGILDLIKYLRTNKINILVTFFIDSCIYGTLAGKIAGVKVIIGTRRDLGYWYTKKLLLIFRVVNFFNRKLLVNSSAIKSNVIKFENVNEQKINVIYNGIELTDFHRNQIIKSSIKNENIIGIVSNLNREVKRVDIFIKAANIILNRLPDVKFMVIGDGSLKSKYISMCKEYNIINNFNFVGSLDNVKPYLSLFTIAVNTSDSEGFSNSILEYLTMSSPVICTNTGGNREIIMHMKNGLLVPPNDERALAEAVFYLLKHKNIRLKFALNGQKTIGNEFAWEFRIREYEQYFESLLN